MIAFQNEPRSRRVQPAGGSYQFLITLEGARPEIWRRLLVPSNANLGWLHAALQITMGWTNSHLHMFRQGKRLISDPAFELDEFEGDEPVDDESAVRLGELLSSSRRTLTYDYDLGDSWIHEITVEKVADPDRIVTGKAVCLDGARACPPEDCGGVSGYKHVLKVLKNPKHREYESMKMWLARPFYPDQFDVEFTNHWLQRLRWPKVTEAALGKLIRCRFEAECD